LGKSAGQGGGDAACVFDDIIFQDDAGISDAVGGRQGERSGVVICEKGVLVGEFADGVHRERGEVRHAVAGGAGEEERAGDPGEGTPGGADGKGEKPGFTE
jgi:hypothetical protein